MPTKVYPSPAAELGRRLHTFWKRRQDGTLHQLLSFKLNGNQLIYATDKEIFTCSLNEFDAEMGDWLPLSDVEQAAESARRRPAPPAVAPSVLNLLPAEIGGTFGNMFETLNAAIDQVKGNPGYVEQANSLNSLVKTSVDVGKLQLEMLRTFAGISK